MYAKEYFTTNHDFENFFNTEVSVNKEETEINKKINSLKLELEKCYQRLTEVNNSKYKEICVPTYDGYVVTYYNRNGDCFSFDLVSGCPFDFSEKKDNEKLWNFVIHNKNSSFLVLVGYCYSQGAILYRNYNVTINSSNTSMRSTVINEILVPIFDSGYILKKQPVTPSTPSIHLKENASEFLNTFFGIDRKIPLNFYEVRYYYHQNPSFENIIKTALKTDEIIPLLEYGSEKAMPITNILNCSEEEYKTLSDNCMVKEYLTILKFLNKNNKTGFKTNHEIIEFLSRVLRWREDLKFYKIAVPDNFGEYLIHSYLFGLGNSYYSDKEVIFCDYYPFGKFCSYVVNETINQGYTNVTTFLTRLRDYLSMCKDMNVTPTLYTSYLAITHDITSRNHTISLNERQEEIFKSRYDNFETYIGENYIVVAPVNSDDVIKEGDELNHCVASYIKRIIDGSSTIYFLRSVKDVQERLITVEVSNGALCQARGIHDRKINNAEREALKEFCLDRNIKFKI